MKKCNSTFYYTIIALVISILVTSPVAQCADEYWQKTYGETNSTYGRSIVNTGDGGFAILSDKQEVLVRQEFLLEKEIVSEI